MNCPGICLACNRKFDTQNFDCPCLERHFARMKSDEEAPYFECEAGRRDGSTLVCVRGEDREWVCGLFREIMLLDLQLRGGT